MYLKQFHEEIMITKVQYFFLKASNTYFVLHGSNNIKVIKAL